MKLFEGFDFNKVAANGITNNNKSILNSAIGAELNLNKLMQNHYNIKFSGFVTDPSLQSFWNCNAIYKSIKGFTNANRYINILRSAGWKCLDNINLILNVNRYLGVDTHQYLYHAKIAGDEYINYLRKKVPTFFETLKNVTNHDGVNHPFNNKNNYIHAIVLSPDNIMAMVIFGFEDKKGKQVYDMELTLTFDNNDIDYGDLLNITSGKKVKKEDGIIKLLRKICKANEYHISIPSNIFTPVEVAGHKGIRYEHRGWDRTQDPWRTNRSKILYSTFTWENLLWKHHDHLIPDYIKKEVDGNALTEIYGTAPRSIRNNGIFDLIYYEQYNKETAKSIRTLLITGDLEHDTNGKVIEQ